MDFQFLVLFKDKEMATQILQSHDPKEQKALGRQVRNFDPKVWNANCKDVVKRGNTAKVSLKINAYYHLFTHNFIEQTLFGESKSSIRDTVDNMGRAGNLHSDYRSMSVVF